MSKIFSKLFLIKNWAKNYCLFKINVVYFFYLILFNFINLCFFNYGKVAFVDEIRCLSYCLWATDGENFEDTNSFTPAVSKYTKLKKEIEATQTEAIQTLSFVEELKKNVAKIEVNMKK